MGMVLELRKIIGLQKVISYDMGNDPFGRMEQFLLLPFDELL
jgi:hypothetical protein